jgi:hypothetical protein
MVHQALVGKAISEFAKCQYEALRYSLLEMRVKFQVG